MGLAKLLASVNVSLIDLAAKLNWLIRKSKSSCNNIHFLLNSGKQLER
jgi:hypothetical protein